MTQTTPEQATLRAAARAAFEADHVTDARSVLAEVLHPFDAATLTVVNLQVEADFALVIFTDGDVALAVRLRESGNVVLLVDDRDGWTELATVESLAHLGEILPTLDPPESALPAWEVGLAVQVGERYTYAKETWEVVQAHTTQADWAPDKTPSLWTKVAT